MSIVVFVLARDGARFYQRETRVADATFAGIVGFQRLRMDIGRAGFLSSPNVRQDPKVCGNPQGDANWPALLSRLVSVRIEKGPDMPAPLATRVAPDGIVLAGSFASPEQFPIATRPLDNGAFYEVYLQPNSGAMARLGYTSTNDFNQQLSLLRSVFAPERALRIIDKAGAQQYATIEGVSAGSRPFIKLRKTPDLRGREAGGCGFRGFEVGSPVNVVNFVRYDVRNVEGHAKYQRLYDASRNIPFENTRTELMRVELDTAGQAIADTEELVAEYVVDLKFALTVVDTASGVDPTLKSLPFGDADEAVYEYTNPHLIRAVRVRMSVRSREADREGDITATDNVAPGLYRIGLGANGTAPYARVRTLQADVALRNQMRPLWGL
jgi:hypothetical protein